MTSMLADNIKVAISIDFLKAFSQIPQKQQSKVREFVEKFRNNPVSAAINYEKIIQAKDKKLRSVRIDQDYRGIVLKPDTGNVYMLLWVDHHDNAYAWAANRVVSIHPETGSLQVVDVQFQQAPDVMSSGSVADGEGGLFSQYKDKELLKLGVPEILMPSVRAIKTEDELDRAVASFPQEAYEALFLLAAGYSVADVVLEMEVKKQDQAVNVEDFDAALENPDTKRRFHVVSDALELAEILKEPLEQWRVFLHPSQQKIVDGVYNGPFRVLGGAGTGKTVVAMHRAKLLAQNMTGNNKILFTTFTKNLAADIADNLKKICPPEILQRIEVINLDAWVSKFLKKIGYEFSIAFDEETRECWGNAMNLSPSDIGLGDKFYKDEWREVIQAQGLFSCDDYLKASRIGRGKRLSRPDKLKIWPVFEEYRSELRRNKYKEMVDAIRDARLLLENQGDTLPYSSIIVDESQDMGMEAFKLIRQIIPASRGTANELFIVGDVHQRIYRNKVVLSRCGIDVKGRSKKLRINYRTTEEIRRWAVHLLEGKPIDDLDGGQDTNKGYKSLMHGDSPEVSLHNSFAEEVEAIAEYLKKLKNDGGGYNTICLVARTNNLLRQYEGALKLKGIPSYFIKRSQAEDPKADGVRMATMHRIKGLEFDFMIIAGCNDGTIPLTGQWQNQADSEEVEENEMLERALLYVCATRAKKRVFITSSGVKSTFLS
jgi:superfamily I DNA/RNA helicase/mRNA-degrading endonuclease RelE of RelBE toxin-antitoxin system